MEDIFQMADLLTEKIRSRFGVSVIGVGEQPPNIADVTTNSYEAYEYYVRGRDAWGKYYNDEAQRFFEKAVELDSTFATAYLWLGRTYIRLGISMEEAYEKARLFAHKTTDKERLYIQARVEEDHEKRIRIYQLIAKRYSNEKQAHYSLASLYRRDKLFDKAIDEYNITLELDPNFGLAYNELGYLYASMGKYREAINCLKRYASVRPGEANPYDTLGDIYFMVGRFDEAVEVYEKASALKPGFSDFEISYIYTLEEDYPRAMDWIDRFIANTPSKFSQAGGYWWRGFYHYLLGRFDLSMQDLEQAKISAKIGELDFPIFAAEWLKGWIDDDRGEFELAKYHHQKWTDFGVKAQPYRDLAYRTWQIFMNGLVDLKQGRHTEARKKLSEIKTNIPEIDQSLLTVASFYYEFLLAEILMTEGSPDRVFHTRRDETLKNIPGLNVFTICAYNVPMMKDVWAQAYVQSGKLDQAIVEYERLITFDPNRKDRRLINPRYHHRLAKLYEERGLKDKAIQRYEKFLDFWKDADEDLPELVDAKVRLAKLKSGS